MVRYNLDEIKEDMVLGESVFLPTGELLLAAGYKIKERYIERLKQLGFRNVLIEVEGTEGVIPETTVSEETQRDMGNMLDETSKELTDAIKQFRNKSSNKVKDFIRENKQHLNKFIMSSGVGKALEQFIDEIMSQTSIVLNLSALQQTQPSLFSHALNVTITSLCIGKRYRFSYEEMKQLGIGALNYDLGLIALPKALMEKPVTEYNPTELKAYYQHTVFGYLMLSQNHIIPSTSAAVALQHHERQDGTGFPRQINGENRPPLKDFSRQNKIHRFAEIVSVADAYDSSVYGRPHEGQKQTDVRGAIRKLIEQSGTCLNSEIVKTLISIVPLFPIGTRIKIVEAPTSQLIGYYGVVARDNPEDLESPQIILFETKNHQRIKPILVDMLKHKGFKLEPIL
ncbi:MAG: HD domain-containing phosphohydrolase [Fibrobacter sp.]|nr:HD domain-containing phosphohydrolase [Fibrobacter sp.]